MKHDELITKLYDILWIPCSERLPDVGEKIICTIVKMSMNEGLYLDVDVVTFSPGYESIIEAWMPCPSPWKPEV